MKILVIISFTLLCKPISGQDSSQIILYALKNNYSFEDRSESQIKKDIKLYEKTGF